MTGGPGPGTGCVRAGGAGSHGCAGPEEGAGAEGGGGAVRHGAGCPLPLRAPCRAGGRRPRCGDSRGVR